MIDTRQLLIQWGVILVAAGIGLFAFSRQTRRREEKKMEEESEDDTRH
jgi:flagellar biosynthesis/type III secretory pathway M-ring protein FliF/YscJ